MKSQVCLHHYGLQIRALQLSRHFEEEEEEAKKKKKKKEKGIAYIRGLDNTN